MPLYGDWDSLIAGVQSRVPAILESDVAPIAENILRSHIQSDIYGAYSPRPGGIFGGRFFRTAYSRRGGLPGSVMHKLSGDGNGFMLLITSDESANTPVIPGYSWGNSGLGAFLQLIEQGGWGAWRNGFSRPAVTNTQNEINSSGAIQAAIRSGIKREIG